MSDRIVLMNGGLIEQSGSPVDVYRQPATTFVSGFIGEVNLLPGDVVVGNDPDSGDDTVGVQSGQCKLRVSHPHPVPVGTKVWISVRPEQLSLVDPLTTTTTASNRVPAVLESSVFLGAFVRHLVTFPDGQPIVVQTSAASEYLDLQPGTDVRVEWPETSGVLLCT